MSSAEPPWSRDMQARASERMRRTEPVVSGADEDIRFVPMTRKQRDRLALHGWRRESDAWDAAPADPAEAIAAEIPEDDDYSRQVARRILAALGAPTTPGE